MYWAELEIFVPEVKNYEIQILQNSKWQHLIVIFILFVSKYTYFSLNARIPSSFNNQACDRVEIAGWEMQMFCLITEVKMAGGQMDEAALRYECMAAKQDDAT